MDKKFFKKLGWLVGHTKVISLTWLLFTFHTFSYCIGRTYNNICIDDIHCSTHSMNKI
jgi:hypothetical protein